MEANTTITGLRQIGTVLRGEPEPVAGWSRQGHAGRIALYVAVIVLGAGLYGAAMGCWRDPRQALYTAAKFPLIILLTTLGNGLLAPLLGLDINFRQSLQAILMSFMISGAILGSFSPVMFFMVWNAPAMSAQARGTYAFIQLTHVMVIAFAGLAANLRLAGWLRRLSGSAVVSRRILFAWLAGNLFLGSQLSWILRPFIGAPGLPVEFLRRNAFDGNFYESVFHAFEQLLFK